MDIALMILNVYYIPFSIVKIKVGRAERNVVTNRDDGLSEEIHNPLLPK
jgi:hypothetical protein